MKLPAGLLLKSLIALVLLGAGLVLAQMWLDLFDTSVFIKLLATLGILCLVLGFVIAVRQDLSREKKLKDDKFVD